MRAERQRKILELIAQNGQVAVADLCMLFGVSEMTVRRDLSELDREGLLRRVHGGAMSSLGRSYEPPYPLRATENLRYKQAIGRTAAKMISDGESVAFDIGTTTLEIARALEGKRNLTILTASLTIANEIVVNYSLESDVRLILTGGVVRARELSMIGDYASRMYADFHVDKAFVGIGGISLKDGLTEYNLEDALVKQALIRSANQVVVVADSTKFGRTTFASVGPLSSVHTVITDLEAPTEMVAALRRMDIEMVIAE
jgi:DeoR/GlpR family transcriptional regulator of sugar metabolism